jgi:hypothetical protein
MTATVVLFIYFGLRAMFNNNFTLAVLLHLNTYGIGAPSLDTANLQRKLRFDGHGGCALRLKCDGTRAKNRFRLSAKRTSPFNILKNET